MAAARTDPRGRLSSSASKLGTSRIEGMDELRRTLRQLASLGDMDYTAIIGTDLTEPPYPFFLEYGTSRMPAYPSARPAFDEMRETATDTTADILGQLLTSPGNIGRWSGESVIRPALEAGALPIRNRWSELARYRTGTYRRSVAVTVEAGNMEQWS